MYCMWDVDTAFDLTVSILYSSASKGIKAVVNSPVGKVLARPLFLNVKAKFHFTKSK